MAKKKGLESIDSFIIDEADFGTETAEQAYQRILRAEKFYGEEWKRKTAPANLVDIESFEKAHFQLEDDYKNFILKHGYQRFSVDEYGLYSLTKDEDGHRLYSFAYELQDQWGHSKEDITKWFEGDFEVAENMFVFASGDESMQTHYFCLMDKTGFYFYDQDSWYAGPYSFDEFVSRVANHVIEKF